MLHARQRTDSIHGTIYLSEFESTLTSTPFFYRLHDIYQSSTVYLTFTANHVKRYEHSLGVMALASEMLFASITNASPLVRNSFFTQLNAEFQALCLGFFKDNIKNGFPYLNGVRKNILNMIEQSNLGLSGGQISQDKQDKKIDHAIRQTFETGVLSDDALNHFSLYSLRDMGPGKNTAESTLTPERERFLYQCLLQAVRIGALFHDVGHPPYSHIIEDTLTGLYNKSVERSTEPFKSFAQESKICVFKGCLGRFIKSEDDLPRTLADNWFFRSEKSASNHLHENAGVVLLERTVESVMRDIMRTIITSHETEKNNSRSCDRQLIRILYYVASIEFAAAILREANSAKINERKTTCSQAGNTAGLFTSIHRIIDGTIDADRLDYVPRDSRGSGVDWGEIPYKRLIDPAKLFQITSAGEIDTTRESHWFTIAYPERAISDIEDFLLNRYKVFTRINYHHRCVRTSRALASCIKFLVKDYLESPDPDSKILPIDDNDLKDLDDRLLREAQVEQEEEARERGCIPMCISPDIHILWTALDNTTGDEALQILQWNDSWMISVLQSALLRIRTEKCFKERYILQAVRMSWANWKDTAEWKSKSSTEREACLQTVAEKRAQELDELKKNLEEFLLNKKSYHSLFKRGMDVQKFVADILKCAGLDERKIRERLIEEQQIYNRELNKDSTLPDIKNCLTGNTDRGDALDAIGRYKHLLEACELGDLKSLDTILPTIDRSIKDILRDVFDQAKQEGRIADISCM